LQSHLGELHLLPALPDAWKEGAVKGLKARGNFEVSVNWKNQRLTGAVIRSGSGGICRIRTSIPVGITGIKAVPVKDTNGYVITFTTIKGKDYTIKAN
jgi:alpha-L-fucosidase 2